MMTAMEKRGKFVFGALCVCVCVSSLKCHHYRAHHRLHGKCLMVACRKRCRFIILITPFATVPQSAHVCVHREKNMTMSRG